MVKFDELRVAWWMFLAAGAVGGGQDFWWQLTTTDPPFMRVITGLVAGVAVCVLLPILFRWL